MMKFSYAEKSYCIICMIKYYWMGRILILSTNVYDLINYPITFKCTYMVADKNR